MSEFLDNLHKRTLGVEYGLWKPANGRDSIQVGAIKIAYRDADVPCNGCTECCKGPNVVFMREDDDPSKYLTREVMTGAGPLIALQNKPNGDCIYLDEKGCSIHTDRPGFCRGFDCRVGMESELVPRRVREAAARLHERETGEQVDLDELARRAKVDD